MKVTLKTIVLAIPALSKLAAEDISLRLAYRLKKNIAELQREADFFGEQRIKILEKYGVADESGNYTFEGDNEQSAMFDFCNSLETVRFGDVTTIDSTAFRGCHALMTADFPLVTSLPQSAFNSCILLRNLNFPNVETLGSSVFAYCDNIREVRFPKATTVGWGAFQDCDLLRRADFPMAEKIDAYCFRGCDALETLIIRTPTVAKLVNKNALQNTAIANGTGYIYVPAALAETYKTTSNWVTYAAQIRAVEDYPEITERRLITIPST